MAVADLFNRHFCGGTQMGKRPEERRFNCPQGITVSLHSSDLVFDSHSHQLARVDCIERFACTTRAWFGVCHRPRMDCLAGRACLEITLGQA